MPDTELNVNETVTATDAAGIEAAPDTGAVEAAPVAEPAAAPAPVVEEVADPEPVTLEYQSLLNTVPHGHRYYATWLHDPKYSDDARHVANNMGALLSGGMERRGLPITYWKKVAALGIDAKPPVFRRNVGGEDTCLE